MLMDRSSGILPCDKKEFLWNRISHLRPAGITGTAGKTQSEWPHILLFYVLPFLVFNSILFVCLTAKPKLNVVVEDTNDYLSTHVVLTVKSFFPTKSVSMTLDGEPLELEKGKHRTYTATVYKNGSIESCVVNLNGMPATVFEHVNVLDDNPPEFSSTDIQDGVVTITLSDSQSGINFDSIYALDSAGERVEPTSVDPRQQHPLLRDGPGRTSCLRPRQGRQRGTGYFHLPTKRAA